MFTADGNINNKPLDPGSPRDLTQTRPEHEANQNESERAGRDVEQHGRQKEREGERGSVYQVFCYVISGHKIHFDSNSG